MDGKNVWFWDIIDSDTRFLVTFRVSYNRGTHDIQMLMEEAKKRAGKSSRVVITGKLYSYLDGIKLTFGGDTEHRQSKPFTTADNSTNKIERWYGRLKDTNSGRN